MTAKRTIDCPTCGRSVEFERVADVPDFPFCSRRCRLADLDRWFEEDYRFSEQLDPEAERGLDDLDGDSRRGGEKP